MPVFPKPKFTFDYDVAVKTGGLQKHIRRTSAIIRNMDRKLKIRDLLCKGSSVSHVTKAGMNIFAELGFPPEEAEKMFADSNRIIKEKLQARTESKSGDSRKMNAKRS